MGFLGKNVGGWLVAGLLLLGTVAAFAQDATELAKATQNPVADLTTVPVQFNFTSGGDLGERTQSLHNVQPVFPLPLSESWNLIARTIVPFLDIPLPDSAGSRENGIGDIQAQLFFTPAKTGAIIWGLGPVISFPTATNDAAATGEFALGPTAVVLKNVGPWVLGGLANNLWHIGGDGTNPDINAFTLQPFINYNLARGWSLSTSPIITANWSAPHGEEWTVPMGLGVAKVSTIGKQAVNLGLQYYNNVERPSGTGEHQTRFVFALLFPRTATK